MYNIKCCVCVKCTLNTLDKISSSEQQRNGFSKIIAAALQYLQGARPVREPHVEQNGYVLLQRVGGGGMIRCRTKPRMAAAQASLMRRAPA